MTNNNIKLLIKIILYLFLAIAFFSKYAIGEGFVSPLIIETFVFGILALIFLYIGYCSEQDYLKAFGYVFAGSFILIFGWFLVSLPKRGIVQSWFRLLLTFPEAIVWALLIPLNILLIYLIIRKLKEKILDFLVRFCRHN